MFNANGMEPKGQEGYMSTPVKHGGMVCANFSVIWTMLCVAKARGGQFVSFVGGRGGGLD